MIADRSDEGLETQAPATDDDLRYEDALADWLRERGSVVIGFSGGVDSAYLACVAVDVLGRDRVLAVIGRSASYPAEQWEGARLVADRFDIPVLETATDELNDPRYAANPSNRCYFCKSELWETLVPIALDRGFAAVVDGTNADDRGDFRPGSRAARERGVRSPLAELGFTKDAIRRLSRRRGLPTWAQPASPCLSSRIPYGTTVTIDRLRQVEDAERALRSLGVTGDLRVRYHGDLARIEVDAAALDQWLDPGAGARIVRDVRAAGFERVAMDLAGFRSGSLNVLGGVTLRRASASRQSAALPHPDALARALAAIGVQATVEGRERLAVVTVAAPSARASMLSVSARAAVIAAAGEHGFTHVALELSSSPGADGSRAGTAERAVGPRGPAVGAIEPAAGASVRRG